MPTKRENFSIVPKSEQQQLATVGIVVRGFDIAGNLLRAYYDSHDNLIFVIDGTINNRKPNVMLVMNQIPGRKWDDILVSDWHIDLEYVRPKKDNKYQKLDIEYNGLDYYDALIRAYKSGNPVDTTALDAWRDDAVRAAARVRLDMAETAATKANDTIAKTDDTIADLNDKLKSLRDKLAQYRHTIGREPTKQSAAKILRTESQIDAVNDKIARAKKRLDNARRRLATAEDDIQSAQELLMMPVIKENDNNAIMAAPSYDIAEIKQSLPPATIPQFTKISDEPKAENMAEEEVKPLLDKDPEILDEEIAFKPIDFAVQPGETNVSGVVQMAESEKTGDDNVVRPLSFTPPSASDTAFEPIADVPPVQSVLNSMRPVSDSGSDKTAAGVTGDANRTIDGVPQSDAFAYAAADAPAVQNPSDVYRDIDFDDTMDNARETVRPAAAARSNPAPMPEISNATNSSGFRPVSPIRGVSGVAVGSDTQPKSKLLYYVLLLVLIVLSVFALWKYQKSVVDNVPELGTVVADTENTVDNPAAQKTVQSQDAVYSSPFVGRSASDAGEEGVATENITNNNVNDEDSSNVPVSTGGVSAAGNPELEVEVFANPVLDADGSDVMVGNVGDADGGDGLGGEQLSVPSETEPENVVSEPVINTIETAVVSESETVADDVKAPVVVDKPEYNVSQNDKMFVAAPDYETDLAQVVPETGAEIADNSAEMCSDGSLPDGNGCCPGEVFTDMENGTFACCQPYEGGECFSPIGG